MNKKPPFAFRNPATGLRTDASKMDILRDIGIRIAVEGRGFELAALSLVTGEKLFAGLLCREHL